MVNLDTNNSQLLQQIQQLTLQASPKTDEQTNDTQSTMFSHYIKKAIETVNNQQNDANTLKTKFTKEDPNVSLSQVMIQMQKAEVSLSALVAVRNKVIDGYKTVMNMPL